MASPPEASDIARQKKSWLVLVLALAASIVGYVLLAYFVLGRSSARTPSSSYTGLRWMLYGLSVVIFGMALAPIRRWRQPDLTPVKFRLESFRSAVLAESVALYGLLLAFVSRSMTDLLVLAGAALLTILLIVLPRGLAYWRLREEMTLPASPIRPG